MNQQRNFDIFFRSVVRSLEGAVSYSVSTNKTDGHILMFKLDQAYHTFASFIFNHLNNPAVSEKIFFFGGISTKKTYIIITIGNEMWNLG